MTVNQEVRIRLFAPRDRAQVLELAPRLTEGVARWRDESQVLAAVQRWIRDSLGHSGEPDHASFVAESEGRVVGIVTVTERCHFTGQVDAYVGELIVAADMQRQGVATRLTEAAEAWATRRDLQYLTLETGAANLAARHLYATLGYQEEDIRLTKELRRDVDLS